MCPIQDIPQEKIPTTHRVVRLGGEDVKDQGQSEILTSVIHTYVYNMHHGYSNRANTT